MGVLSERRNERLVSGGTWERYGRKKGGGSVSPQAKAWI